MSNFLKGSVLGPCSGNKCGGPPDDIQQVVSCCFVGVNVGGDGLKVYAPQIAEQNLALVPLQNNAVYLGADGKKYTFGYSKDKPVAGTTMAWQVCIWVIFSDENTSSPPLLYFNPNGTALPRVGQKNFPMAANCVAGDRFLSGTPNGTPLSFDMSPPGTSFRYENASVFSMQSAIRTSKGVISNFSASGQLNSDGAGVFSVLSTDPQSGPPPSPYGVPLAYGPPVNLGVIGQPGEFVFNAAQCGVCQLAGVIF